MRAVGRDLAHRRGRDAEVERRAEQRVEREGEVDDPQRVVAETDEDELDGDQPEHQQQRLAGEVGGDVPGEPRGDRQGIPS